MDKTVLKQLIDLANRLDERNMVKAANAVDNFIKLAFPAATARDLTHAVQFYNDMNLAEISPNDLIIKGITTMPPEEFMPGLDTSDKGWLKEFPKDKWPALLTEKYTRDFSHIVRMYNAGHVSPAIQIDGNFADGMARSIFFNAIGEDMPVAQFVTDKQETELL